MNFKIDFWTIWGLVAQGFFFSRFLLQWYQSEKQGKIVIPHVFWFISLIASVMLLVYSIARNDIVFFISAILQIILFTRSLWISKKEKASIKL